MATSGRLVDYFAAVFRQRGAQRRMMYIRGTLTKRYRYSLSRGNPARRTAMKFDGEPRRRCRFIREISSVSGNARQFYPTTNYRDACPETGQRHFRVFPETIVPSRILEANIMSRLQAVSGDFLVASGSVECTFRSRILRL